MKDKRTEQGYSNAMVWHINTTNMLYGQMFQSSFTSFEDFLYGDAKRDTFESDKTKCARFEKRNVQKSGKTKRSKNFAHTTL